MQPRKGDRYRAVRAVEVSVVTQYSAAFSGGGQAILPGGEIVVVPIDPMPGATGLYVVPERYDDLRDVLVSRDERQDERFAGYSIALSHDELRREFVLLEDGESAKA